MSKTDECLLSYWCTEPPGHHTQCRCQEILELHSCDLLFFQALNSEDLCFRTANSVYLILNTGCCYLQQKVPGVERKASVEFSGGQLATGCREKTAKAIKMLDVIVQNCYTSFLDCMLTNNLYRFCCKNPEMGVPLSQNPFQEEQKTGLFLALACVSDSWHVTKDSMECTWAVLLISR